MKTSSHFATTKNDRALGLTGESNDATEIELITLPAHSSS